MSRIKGTKLTPEWIAKRVAHIKGKKLPEGWVAASARGHMKPCTVGGGVYYDSWSSLAKALGRGRASARHPNFRYLTPEEIASLGQVFYKHDER